MQSSISLWYIRMAGVKIQEIQLLKIENLVVDDPLVTLRLDHVMDVEIG